MGELLGALKIAEIGPWGLLILLLVGFFVALQRGTLVTGKLHDEQLTDLRASHDVKLTDLRASYEGRLQDLRDSHSREMSTERARGDDWKAAFDSADARADLTSEQVRELVDQGRTFTHFIEAVRGMVDRGGQT